MKLVGVRSGRDAPNALLHSAARQIRALLLLYFVRTRGALQPLPKIPTTFSRGSLPNYSAALRLKIDGRARPDWLSAEESVRQPSGL